MHALLSAWPVISLLLPALVLVSAIYFVARGDRRALAQLLALLACFVVGALLMEFFVFMAARMARAGSPPTVPVLGTGTRQLLATMSHPRSLVAPPLSLAAVAAYSVLAAYLWVLVTWGLHQRGKPAGGARKKPAKGARKPARS